jgi:hypothetical protein
LPKTSTRTELPRPDLHLNVDLAKFVSIAHALLDVGDQRFDALFLWQADVGSDTPSTRPDEERTKHDKAE